MRTYQLSALDRSYLEAETSETPFHIACLVLVESGPLTDRRGRVRIRAIRSHVGRRWQDALMPHLRLRYADSADAHPSEWQEDETLDLARHVVASRVPGAGTQRDLLAHCAILLKRPLSRDIPLWRIHVLTGLADERIGLLFQIHHSLTDGVGSSLLLGELLDVASTALPRPEPQEVPRSERKDTGLPARVSHFVSQTVGALTQVPEGLGFLARSLSSRPATSLNAEVTNERQLLTNQVTFAAVREIAHALDVTINDVVLGAVAGAIGVALEERGETVSELTLKALVPVSTRSVSTLTARGNHTAVLQVPLPLGIYHPVERTRAVSNAMTQRKQHHVADAVVALESLASHLHLPLESQLTKFAFDHQKLVNLVITNVAGPQQRMAFMSASVKSVFAFLPLASDLPISIAVCTYDGMLSVGVTVDPSVVPDGEDISQGIVDQLSMLHRLAVMRRRPSARQRAVSTIS